MPNTFPRVLAGRYSVSFTDHSIKPLRLIDTKPGDQQLLEIRFSQNRTGQAVFENGSQISFDVKWDGISDSYTFVYNEVPHMFSTKRDLGEVLTHVNVMSLNDLEQDYEN
jgi:hypothetical protein